MIGRTPRNLPVDPSFAPVFTTIALVLNGALGVLASIVSRRFATHYEELLDHLMAAKAGRAMGDEAELIRAIAGARWTRALDLLEAAPRVAIADPGLRDEVGAREEAFRREVLRFRAFIRRSRWAAVTTCGTMLLAVAMLLLALNRLPADPTYAVAALAITAAAGVGSLATFYPLVRDALARR